MNASIDVMTGMLRPLAIRLMGMPSGMAGYTAGPTFRPANSVNAMPELKTREAFLEISARLGGTYRKALSLADVPGSVVGMFQSTKIIFETWPSPQ